MSTEARATYRVQLHAAFGFEAAAGLAPYLAALGVSHLYSSPILQAVPGSMHGYDVVDHSRVNGELGGERGRRHLAEALEKAGLGELLDIVPNHMAIHTWNRWWWDVLENGPSSRYATYFDVDWDPPESRLHNLVLLPVLGDHYGRVLDRGELKLERTGGSFLVRYFDHMWPAAPRALDGLLAAAAERSRSEELAFLAESFGRLPLPRIDDRRGFHRRHRDKEALKRLLDQLLRASPEVAEAVDAEVARANEDPGLLHPILEGQNYRLAFWRKAAQDLGYRRFFDVNTLVALRAEDERVFAETHVLVLDWLRHGALDGVRIDHPDGLRDPQAYFERLRAAAPEAWIVAEKILMPGEALPAGWPIQGTTGYDFANVVLGLFVDPRAEEALTRLYAEFTGQETDFEVVEREKKRFVLREVLGSDLNRLTAQLADVCERHREHRDYTRHDLHEALLEMIAALPVYRTYVRAEQGSIGEADRALIGGAVAAASAARPDLERALFDFIGSILTLDLRGELETELVMRFQQATGPVAAKGVEDTAFYTYARFVCLNEVGGDPGRFGADPAEFHAWCERMGESWPRTLLATATHDTKRGEDLRARLALLSEVPDRWQAAVRGWAAMNEGRRGRVDRNAEYLFYQTLVGAWPLDTERARAYMLKAAREAKTHTSWTRPDEAYERDLEAFVTACLSDGPFCAAVEEFVRPLVHPGRVNSLAQTLLKLAAPGVPDIYQGCELWDLSLVDPDNRRPVDYELRRRLLAELDGLTAAQIMERMDEGLPKLWLVRQALALRARQQAAFDGSSEEASYAALAARGERAAHAVALQRGGRVVAVAPRLVIALAESGWGDTSLPLPPGQWTNVLDGEAVAGEVRLADLLARFPVALLEIADAPS